MYNLANSISSRSIDKTGNKRTWTVSLKEANDKTPTLPTKKLWMDYNKATNTIERTRGESRPAR
jgi:hypothetical protein